MEKEKWKHYVFENGSLSDEQRKAAIETAEGLISGAEGASFHLPTRYTEAVDGTSTERTTEATLTFTAFKLLSYDSEENPLGGVVLAGELCWRRDGMPITQRQAVLTVGYCADRDGKTPDAIIDTDHLSVMQYYNATTTPKSAP
ncbi:MAG: hypothetical protein Q4A34_00220 [Candidatus Saccharibacteria bacterium]|nr:hypothetical protein [Candidatus Saccharibacteria bacterium]